MNVINDESTGVPIFSWCPEIEESALDQMRVLSKLPFVKHCALMPDAHTGMGMPIGGVIACDRVVIPNAVGVDIGCGMCAIKTSLQAEQLTDEIKGKMLHSFKRSIPVGFQHNDQRRIKELKNIYHTEIVSIFERLYKKVSTTNNPIDINSLQDVMFEQVGTCGGGNHFLEIQKDVHGNIWIMIHSGSRNIGKKVCDYFNNEAELLNKKYFSQTTIPFLPTDDNIGMNYLAWMNFALEFAFMNRQVMMNAITRDIDYVFSDVKYEEMINIHHNFASLEHHFGKDLWIHRKGATQARKDMLGIIPGSMGSNSYIVRGDGNDKSMESCSHGAGRRMGRMDFNRRMNNEDGINEIEKSLEGIVHSGFTKVQRGKKNKNLMDYSEAPQAYKDIDDVINNELDLITPIVKLTPLISLKG